MHCDTDSWQILRQTFGEMLQLGYKISTIMIAINIHRCSSLARKYFKCGTEFEGNVTLAGAFKDHFLLIFCMIPREHIWSR